MGKRIGILGVGAVGSYIGAFLTRNGHDVTLIDMWGEHVNIMNQKGLRVSGTQAEFTVPVNAVHLTNAQDIKEPFDIAFLAVKSYDTEWAAHFLKRLISPSGVVLSSQNCMNDHLIASIVGYERVVPCVMSGITVALWEAGHVTRGGQPGREGHDVFRIGEMHGHITTRVKELVELVSCIDGARATTNIWGERWSKLTTNAAGNPVQGMTGLGSSELSKNPRARLLQVHISKESVQVGLAHNIQVEPVGGIAAGIWANAERGEVLGELESKFQGGGGGGGGLDWKSSMGQDVAKGRRTEVEYMNGFIATQGESVNIPTPVNKAIVEIVKEIDLGITKPHPSNIERVLSIAGL